MDALIPIICCTFCFVSGVLIVIFTDGITNTRCLNSSVYYAPACGIKPVELNVIKIEEASDTKGNLIAKYTLDVHFFAKENCKDWKYDKFYIYDDVNKYKIGDILTLIK